MTGRVISLGSTVGIKKGKIVRVHKLDASKRKRIHAQAKREADKWIKPAEHYTPLPATETDK